MANMFSGASNFAVAGGTFTINQTNNTQTMVHTSAFDKLTAAAAHSALHDAPARTDESRCHQRTRTNVLDYLERWAQGICDEGRSIFWLHGGAGAGKSAIMQTLAERCVAQKLALGSFFFFRGDHTRNTAEVLIPTLVYQLAQLFSPALHVLDTVINGDPLIFKKSFQVQLLGLFVPALQHLVQLGVISNAPQSPRVFLIDGLDECDNAAQHQAIIRAVVAVCHEHRVPVKFLIASRPEQTISTSLEWFSRKNCVLGAVSLSDDPDAEDDIRQFIEDEFLKISLQHPFRRMIPAEWPYLLDIDSIVLKSSSHFIYASTAMKYIWSARENPVRSLQVVLGLEVSRTESPFSELDALYHHILGSAAHRDKVLQILMHCIYATLTSSASIICFMLKCSRNDLTVYMAGISALVDISQSLFHGEEVKVLHASLGDFFLDQSRSQSFCVDKAVYLASKFERCLQLFDVRSQPHFIDSTPDYPENSNIDQSHGYYSELALEIITTIEISGDLLATEEVLGAYSLRDFYQCQLRFKQDPCHAGDLFGDLCKFLIVVHWMKTPNAVELFKSFAEDFFDILELYVQLESTPLAPATVTLAFSGFPAPVVRRILRSEFDHGKPFCRLLSFKTHSKYSGSVLDIMANVDPTSVHYSTNVSPKCLAVAAEAILDYLTDQIDLQFLSTYSTHKLWLQRTKPGKHIATGAPRLASVFHTLCLDTLRRCEDADYAYRSRYQFSPTIITSSLFDCLFIVLGPKYGRTSDTLRYRRDKIAKVVDLIEALLWLLPKAGFSEKIVRYSKRVLPWKIYQRKAGLVYRVRKCLDDYTTRMQNAKLEELDQRMVNGDVNALVEKSRMLYLDAQD